MRKDRKVPESCGVVNGGPQKPPRVREGARTSLREARWREVCRPVRVVCRRREQRYSRGWGGDVRGSEGYATHWYFYFYFFARLAL